MLILIYFKIYLSINKMNFNKIQIEISKYLNYLLMKGYL